MGRFFYILPSFEEGIRKEVVIMIIKKVVVVHFIALSTLIFGSTYAFAQESVTWNNQITTEVTETGSATIYNQHSNFTGQASDPGEHNSSSSNNSTPSQSSQQTDKPPTSASTPVNTPGSSAPGGQQTNPGGSTGSGGSEGSGGSGTGLEADLIGYGIELALKQLPNMPQDPSNRTVPDTINYIPGSIIPDGKYTISEDMAGAHEQTTIDKSTTQSGLTIRGYTPLYWDWKFNNITDGKSIFEKQQPMYSINQYFDDPGHWFVYYHEYAKWETGYWETVTVTTHSSDSHGHSHTSHHTVRVWHHVSWEQGYMYPWRYLTDFYLSEWEIKKTWTVPSGVQEHRLDVETVQQVAK